MSLTKDEILASLKKVEAWVESKNYKGYEPFDGLSSWFRPLTLGNLFLDRILMQLVRQSPINLRPLFGVKPMDSTIGQGYMAWGYLAMLKHTGNDEYKRKAVSCLEWLIKNKSPGYEEYSWGKHFDFASRGGRYPTFEPITIWTCLICQPFLDAYEMFGEKKYLEVADSVCRWILSLGRNKTDEGICINYTGSQENEYCTIHNHSMFGAAILARVAKHTANSEYLDLARQIMDYSCVKQHPNGAWWYAEAPNMHWIDNFHSGYNIDSLKGYIENSGDNRYEDNLRRGLTFLIENFFEESGRPKYYHDRTYPVDSQCASQAIETLANFAEYDDRALPLAKKVAAWWITNMQSPKGFFYYRQYPLGIKAKTPMLHWAQATTYKALTLLYKAL
jgi:rhamnogalacturonyl hydrolase YesR